MTTFATQNREIKGHRHNSVGDYQHSTEYVCMLKLICIFLKRSRNEYLIEQIERLKL